MTISVSPLAAGLGAEVIGVDLATGIDDQTFAAIEKAWLDYQVLVFRDQHLTHAQHIEFSRRFGKLDDHSSIPKFRDPVHNEILRVTNDVVAGRKQTVGRQWHSDLSITVAPARGSLLRCEALPPVGGDTMFANTYLAFDTLSQPLQKMLSELSAIHDIAHSRQNRGRADLAEARLHTPPVVHPVVKFHPVTNRPALFVNEMSTSRIVGLAEEESKAILDLLFAHISQPELTYRHRWRLHDLIIWDNECTQHLALSDYDIEVTRTMYRTTLLGMRTGRVATEQELS
jgi:taurine dioxygenase